jgi:autotransporter family porin
MQQLRRRRSWRRAAKRPSGLRTDSGYRFGSCHGGAFIEPIAIIAVNWAEIDGFTLGGNKVSVGDDPDVRGD